VEIFPLPVAEFAATTVCIGEFMQFSDNSSLNTISWEYNFNDSTVNSTSQNPSHNFLSPGVYNVDLLVFSDMGCKNENKREVNVNHLPDVDFSIENTCLGNPNTFVNLSSVEGSSISNISFDFGNTNTSSDSITTFTYLSSGVFSVNLSATSKVGCEKSITKKVEVFDLPEVDFTTSQFCFGLPTQFVDRTTIADAIIIDWLWSFDDGLAVTSSQHPEYKFTNAGTFNVSLTTTSNMGCEFTKREEVSIYELPKVNFEINSELCLNKVVRINDLSDGNGSKIKEWNYTFGDGTSSSNQNPTHAFSYINQFDITLIVTTIEACENDTTISVNVHPLPTANFQASTLITSEIDAEIEFFNISEDASEIFWDFDNGVTSIVNNPILEFSNIGNYDVLLTAISEFGCEDNIIRTVSINPEYTIFVPSAFTPDGDGINDIFTAKGNAIEIFEMQVYDRWGSIVFESNSIDNGWDGKNVSGDWANNGLYLYHIATYDKNGRLWVYNGELNLMR
jgi:gliding motility-associated-like protein